MSEIMNADTDQMWKQWRNRIFITVWVTYLTYYLGRVNFGIAKSFIEAEYPLVDAGALGLIGTLFFIMYMN